MKVMVEMIVFDDKDPGRSPSVFFETTEKEFRRMMKLLHCQYDEGMGLWYAADNSIAYDLVK